MNGATRRFACTQCGKCCNRAPEIELSEAAALADVFVFRLMFRLYSLPRVPDCEPDRRGSFYAKKRLLGAHAARSYPKRYLRGGKSVEHINYLMISALALDSGGGACPALTDNRCSIYDRRPLGCRTVPLHYSRTEGSAGDDLMRFVATPGYACDVGQMAPVVIDGTGIVDEAMREARSRAMALAVRDAAWKQGIARRMKSRSCHADLPALGDIEANAAFGALTSSMRVAWEIAVEQGVIDPVEYRALIMAQTEMIERELGRATWRPEDRQTLIEMRADYRQALAGKPSAL